MRHLATIQKIKNVEPIEGKDRIHYVGFENVDWRCIAPKSMKIGDLVLYCEVDSVLPCVPELEFLKKRCYSNKCNGYHIGAMRMGGKVSYGIALGLDDIKGWIGNKFKPTNGLDVTDTLKVTKYDDYDVIEVSHGKTNFLTRIIERIKRWLIGKKNKCVYPVSKTDETRIQILPYVYEKCKGMLMYSTVKMDGQSLTACVKDKYFYLCSRNIVLEKIKISKGNPVFKSNSKFHATCFKYRLYNILCELKYNTGLDICIQGEQCGRGIQNNRMDAPDNSLYVFNVKDLTHNKYYSWDDIKRFCNCHQLETVPFIEEFVFNWENVEQAEEYARGKYANGHNREGVVIRAVNPQEPLPEMVNMLSFKVINPDYITQEK